jgi:hypothetical protein
VERFVHLDAPHKKYAITPLYFMESKISKNYLQILKILHIGTLKQLPSAMIHYLIHEIHPTDVKVIFDLDENPEKGNNNPYI